MVLVTHLHGLESQEHVSWEHTTFCQLVTSYLKTSANVRYFMVETNQYERSRRGPVLSLTECSWVRNCPVKKAFTSRDALKRHLNIHQAIHKCKELECGQCERQKEKINYTFWWSTPAIKTSSAKKVPPAPIPPSRNLTLEPYLVSWIVCEEVYELDKAIDIRMLPKLTDKHT